MYYIILCTIYNNKKFPGLIFFVVQTLVIIINDWIFYVVNKTNLNIKH